MTTTSMSAGPDPTGGAPDPTGGRASVEALQALIEESRQLRTDMRAAQEQQQRRIRGLQFTTALLVVAGIVLSVVMVQMFGIARGNAEISAQIADCTNEGGACWEESRARSRANVTGILNTTIYVAECLRRVGGVQPQARNEAELEACIRQQLFAGRQPVPVPTPTPRPTTPAPVPGTSS